MLSTNQTMTRKERLQILDKLYKDKTLTQSERNTQEYLLKD